MFASNTIVNHGLKKFDNIGNSVKLKDKLITTAGNTEGGSITVPLTSCLTGLELAV